ncbi:hypothetical protein [Haloarcula pelagica]|uniref:hypothetical protein n=1 Tax=Haloarcula pelagica TaxID=3033389 RepID=UPI0024C2E611|nr:hypothetical protein [Halomicroarcula sp. YJ-61-S]
MAEDDRTITRTRTEHRVEEVEEELHLCRNCDQAYQPDEMLTVGVDISKHDRAYAKRKLCAGCADSVLDYAEPQDSRDHLEATLVENRRTVWLAGLPWLAGGVAILTAAVFGDVVGVFEGAAAIIATGFDQSVAALTAPPFALISYPMGMLGFLWAMLVVMKVLEP